MDPAKVVLLNFIGFIHIFFIVIKRRKTARKTDSIDYKRANETKNTKSRHMQYLSRRKFEKFKPLEVSGALVTEQYISENGLHWPLIFNPGDGKFKYNFTIIYLF